MDQFSRLFLGGQKREDDKEMKIGFIGCGNMGSAMLRGILEAGTYRKEDFIVCEKSEDAKKRVEKEFQIRTTESCRAVVEFADIIFLTVKPQYYEEVIGEIRTYMMEKQIFVSVAPGKSLEWIGQLFGRPVKLVRTMPNTPAMVKEGMTAYCVNGQVCPEEKAKVVELCRCFSEAEEVDEHLMDVVTAVSGSSPAYVFMFIEAMADAAVADGMPRDKAYKFAAQAVLGSAKMVLETGKHPAELKDMVCSPGGTTIEAVRVLEEKGLRSSIIEASRACVAKSRQM